MTTEGAMQLTRMNLVGSDKDEKDDHIFACHDAIRWLAQRLDEEIKWGHRECTHDDCKSSGTDCPANSVNHMTSPENIQPTPSNETETP